MIPKKDSMPNPKPTDRELWRGSSAANILKNFKTTIILCSHLLQKNGEGCFLSEGERGLHKDRALDDIMNENAPICCK